MPEHAEVHRSCHVVKAFAQQRRFTAAYEVRGKARRLLEGTEHWDSGFGITAFSRGKELALVLQEGKAFASAFCATCYAIAQECPSAPEPKPCRTGICADTIAQHQEQSDKVLTLGLRFGMHGGVDVIDTSGAGRKRGSNTYIQLVRNDGLIMYINAWHSDGMFDCSRSPDPLSEHISWCSVMQERCFRPAAAKVPLCEALLDQSLANGSLPRATSFFF